MSRLSIPKLAAAVAPLRIQPKFRSELLRSGVTWPQDVNYLRDTYMDIYVLWEKADFGTTHQVDSEGTKSIAENKHNPEDDKRLFTETTPKIRELILGLEDVMRQVTNRPDVFRMTKNAEHDFTTAESYARIGDFAMATVYQSYSLLKLHRILDGLMLMANKKTSRHVNAYGYDTSGEVGESGQQERGGQNIDDQGNSPKFDRTPTNPANSMVDPEAENDYPEHLESKHKRVEWPARTR